jgi:spermidine synthase
MFETQSTFPEEVIHFPLLEHPRPRTILLIGGGAGGSLREALKHPVDQVRYVELDPALIEAARSQLPPGDRAAFDDPRAVVTLVDGRLYVKTSNQRFDVIIVDLPEPSTGQLNRFYTEEFFREAKALLNEGGILSLGLPAAENYLNPEIRRRNGSVYHTLRAVFPYVLVLPGDHNFFLASDAPLSTDPPVLIRRLKERNIATRYVHEAYITYIFTTDRFRSTQESLERAEPVKLNRDLVPICYFYDMVLWLSMFYSNLNDLFYAASLLNLPWLIVPAILMVLWLRRRPLAVPIVIGLTGFAGITLEVVILLAFQSLRGYIYHEVSLIAAAFMLGTALGGAAMNQALVRTSPTVRWLAVVQIAILLYAIALPTALAGAASLPLTRNLADLIFPTLMGLAGFLGGLEFPVAVALTQGSTRRVDAPAPILDRGTPVGAVASVAGLLYGADLLGACFGAILASVLLIPLLGIPQTCGIVGFLSLLGLSLLVP